MKKILLVLAMVFCASVVFAEGVDEREKVKYEIRALAAEINSITFQLKWMQKEADALVASKEQKLAELNIWKKKLEDMDKKPEKKVEKKAEDTSKKKVEAKPEL